MAINILQDLSSAVGRKLGVKGTAVEQAAFAELWAAYTVRGYRPQLIQPEKEQPTIAIILDWPDRTLEELQPQIDDISARVERVGKKYGLELACSAPSFGHGGGGYVMWVKYEKAISQE